MAGRLDFFQEQQNWLLVLMCVHDNNKETWSQLFTWDIAFLASDNSSYINNQLATYYKKDMVFTT